MRHIHSFSQHASWKQVIKSALGGLCLASALLVGGQPAAGAAAPKAAVQQAPVHTQWSQQWAPEVRASLQELCERYGKNSPGYKENRRPYAILDFDNTTSIGNVQEQLMIWQLEHLAFAIQPEDMEKVLQTGISRQGLQLTYGAENGEGAPVRIGDAIADAARAYGSLYQAGLVSRRGSVPDAALRSSSDYQEFVGKMRWLYTAISQTMDASAAYPWMTYWFTGMKPLEVYTLAYDCDSFYGNAHKWQSWKKAAYTTPKKGLAGSVTVSYQNGITVTPEMKELYSNLQKNGIDAWIVSSSSTDVIRAAVDYFQIKGVNGIQGMMNQLDSQQCYTNAYDYSMHVQTQGPGKVQTINKTIRPNYKGAGPVLCAMDSQEDFAFATEYRDTKAVLVVNRYPGDDAALCAGIASYQQLHDITLDKANAAGNAKFLLQGRDENAGIFWPQEETLRLGETEPSDLSDKSQRTVRQLEQGKSIKDVLKENTTVKKYHGYKSR